MFNLMINDKFKHKKAFISKSDRTILNSRISKFSHNSKWMFPVVFECLNKNYSKKDENSSFNHFLAIISDEKLWVLIKKIIKLFLAA